MCIRTGGTGIAAVAWLVVALFFIVVPAASGDMRLRGFDAVEGLFAAGGPDRLLAGEQVVAASGDHVYGWPVAGGSARRLGRLPDLGPSTNDIPDGGGFVRVEAARPGRVVVVRGEGRALEPGAEVGPGHHVVVGPPEGPFTDPAGCGERSGGPAGLSGELIAYVAAPASEPPCGRTTPAARGPVVVVRDLAAGAALVRSIELAFDGAVAALRFDGPFVGLELRSTRPDPNDEPAPPAPRTLVVVDIRTGAAVTRVPVRGEVPWDIGPDGTLVRGRYRQRGAGLGCGALADHLRLHPPGDSVGRKLTVVPCAFPAPELRANGVLRLVLPRRDGRIRVVDRRVDDGADRVLAVVAGPFAGGDDRHLIVGDATCRVLDARVLAVHDEAAGPSGPRTCPVVVRAPRTARSGGSLPVAVTCPSGCRGSIELQVFRPTRETTFGFGRRVVLAPGGSRTYRFRLPRRAALGRASRGTLEVSVASPVASRGVRRPITILPAQEAPRTRRRAELGALSAGRRSG